jgi:hypothetical protein
MTFCFLCRAKELLWNRMANEKTKKPEKAKKYLQN